MAFQQFQTSSVKHLEQALIDSHTKSERANTAIPFNSKVINC